MYDQDSQERQNWAAKESRLNRSSGTAPCPTCKRPMPARYLAKGYQCDGCANAEEGCY